jgi:hypothetical protein
MVTRKQQLDIDIDFLVSTKVGNLHDIQQGGLREVHSPRLRDYLRILPLSSGQVLMWGDHVIYFSISEVEVAKLQRYNLILVCLNCAYPLLLAANSPFFYDSISCLHLCLANIKFCRNFQIDNIFISCDIYTLIFILFS